MCRKATVRVLAAAALCAAAVSAQDPASAGLTSEWRRVGNTVLALGLPSPASGPVERVWFSPDGRTIYGRAPSGNTWQTSDLEHWTAVADAQPVTGEPSVAAPPEPGAKLVVPPLRRARVYAAGTHFWRSDDGGVTWSNLTRFDGISILGGRIADLAVSLANPDEVVVAGETGVWRTADGGDSWVGLNDGLPNFPGLRLLALPANTPTVRVASTSGREVVWTAGESAGWRPDDASVLAAELRQRAAIAAAVQADIAAVARSGDEVYAGASDGRLFASADRGRTWRPYAAVPGSGGIVRLVADARDPQFAIAITASRQRGRVLRTLNGGALWDDITGNIPPGPVNGVAADRLTGAVYVASPAGVYMTYTDVAGASPAAAWTQIREGVARDVALDAEGNQLYVLFEGAGVFARLAPHRARDPRVVSAGDRILRAAAPGSLLSVLGARVESAQAGASAAAVLDAGETESQVQLPFDLSGTGVVVSMRSASGRLQIGLPLSATSPSIFVDRDGNPLVMNADTGLMLDAGTPARSNARIQILATGLGRVTPNWPTGLAAPLQDAPRVVAPVRAYLDREPLEVTRATLAPGYVGMYLVEVQLPAIVNRGTAELSIQAGEESSNRVRIFLEP